MNLIRTLVLAVAMAACFPAFSQDTTRPRAVLNESTVVTDSSGMIYPFPVWQKMMQSGNYTITSKYNKEKAAFTFLLVALTPEEKAKRLERMPKPRETTNFKTGEKLDNFIVVDMNNKKYKSKDLVGKVLVINFWFINCPPCRQEIPELNKLVEKYKNNPDVIFLAPALDQYSELKDFLKTTPYNYNIVPDGRSFASQFGIHSYPTHVITDRVGNVVFHTFGLAGNTVDWIGKSIEAALATEALAKAVK